MTRAAMKHGIVQPVTVRGADGIEYVPVEVRKSYPFTVACLAVWKEHDGVDRAWMLRNRTINVPAAYIDMARLRLEGGGQ